METEANRLFTTKQLEDEELVKSIPGFTNRCEEVNGIHVHFVEGGQGYPLVLIPGYPETWWAYHKIMPALANKYHVIVVDIRGMGSSDKPQNGYDKKNMARDILELVQKLGYAKIYMAGHDIGAHVAFSFAANFPQNISKLILLDTPHPDAGMYQLPMLPIPGLDYTYPWWVAFNQVKELPEQLLVGRLHYQFDWMFDHLLTDKTSIGEFDRAVYLKAYDSKDGIRAANNWYQAFAQDIEDSKTYGKITVPVVGIGASGYDQLQQSLPATATDYKLVRINNSGHFIAAEKPKETADAIIEFLTYPSVDV